MKDCTMTAFLTQDLADALCTIITVGYIHEDGNKTAFQYQDAVASPEQISYSAVAKALSAYNVALNVTQSPSQQVSPFIVAKTPKVPNFDAAAFINTDYWRYIQKIMSTANKLDNPPKGAYIGGMSSISKLNIVGPSTIVQVPVRYRNVDDATMSKRYQSAVDGSNLALSCLQNTGAALPKGMGVDTTLLPKRKIG